MAYKESLVIKQVITRLTEKKKKIRIEKTLHSNAQMLRW